MSTQKSYEKKVINGEIFDIEEYEVFQIIDKRFSPLKLIKKMFNFSVKMYKKTEKTTRKKIDKKKMRREEAYRFAWTFSIENNESLVDVIIASDELELLEIYQQLEKHLLENESDWKFPKDFITLCQFRHDDHFSNLYQVAIDLVYMPSNNSEFYNNHKCKTSDSFIFSLFSSTNGVIPTLSRVSSKKEAIIWCKDKGPCFGLQDLWIQSSSRSGRSKQKSYEKTIINKETFEIEEYEVYQIIDTRFSYYEFIKRIFNEEQDLKQETSNHKSASELEYGRRIIRLIEIPD
ncbi:20073_t:CDS:2 [Rhizophagus irregularis]|nr:20073_t:CDS:2 [Rhizophagus irregularis]